MEETSIATSKYTIPIYRLINQTFSYCRVNGDTICEETGVQNLYGGDGDDYLKPGNNWDETYTYGENGNDTFIAPSGNDETTTYFKGGDGNDTVIVAAYGDLEDSENVDTEYFKGGDGDDVIRGSHKNAGANYLYGGNGEDKLYGGDGTKNYLYGNAGDDWIRGGDNGYEQYIYGDEDESQTGGDDVIYGGNNGKRSQFIVGGKGNDKIFSGHNMQNSNDSRTFKVSVYGDNYFL